MNDTPPFDHQPPPAWSGWPARILYLPVGFLYLVSGLAVPGPAVIVLLICWMAGLVFTFRLAARRPLLALVMTPAALGFWFLYLTAGERLFGWTA